MKKQIKIAGSVLASAAMAAMPVVGVYAADGALTTTDTVQVTIDSACALTATGNTSAFSASLTNGNATADNALGSTSINIKCNDPGAWQVNAYGSNSSTVNGAGATDMAPTKDTSAPIATGTTLDGSVSNWAMKLTAGTGSYAPTIAEGFNTWHAVPAPGSAETKGTKVVSGPVTDQTTGSSFTTNYKVGVSATQQADTYTGKVTYDLIHPAA